ncbi:MAG TPA: 2-C-methyl-D-erythritol 4-phosphate cytidylyltransferase [Nocardioidaceae bacterium]|nr:2-C-methyl-D-erythritol 4-phosphate cytidylyltransferase [Nocardioidaceae bacterium]
MSTAAIVPAAGDGLRLGADRPKALVSLAGEPLVVHALRGLRASEVVDRVIVAAPIAAGDELRAALPSEWNGWVRVIDGGATRQASVAAGLEALSHDHDLVLVHDAARALVPPAVVVRVVDALLGGADAVIPVLAMADTVKRVRGGVVLETVDRAELYAVQTPQGFQRRILAAVHAAAVDSDAPATDDAALVERAGGEVCAVDGDSEAFKITRPLDLALAEAVLRSRRHSL